MTKVVAKDFDWLLRTVKYPGFTTDCKSLAVLLQTLITVVYIIHFPQKIVSLEFTGKFQMHLVMFSRAKTGYYEHIYKRFISGFRSQSVMLQMLLTAILKGYCSSFQPAL